MIEQIAPARLDEPVEEETARELEDDNRVLLIRRLERTVEHELEDDAEQVAEPAEDVLQDDLDAMLDEAVEEMPAEETLEEDRKAARAAAKQQKAAARDAVKQAQREAEDARKRAEAEAKAARAAQLEEERAAMEAAKRAEEAAKAEAKAAAKRERRAGKQRPAAAIDQPKLNRRERGFQRDIETLGLVEDETVTMSLRGRAFGPATLIVTNFRVAVVGGRRTSVRWIPFEEVNQIDTMWRGAPTVLVGGTVEVLRFRMRSEQKLSEIVHMLMTDVQASKVPGSAHHNAELTQAWCDKAGEVWDSHTGRIRLFIRRHPAFTLSWLTTLVPVAYFAAR